MTMTDNTSTDPEPPKPSPDSASLLKRLAGPSSTKAGLAKDQTEINRIIAEASKGSKFYENEKRKDKELSDRIARILKQRDEVVQGVDVRAIEKSIDHLIEELESQRDLSQVVIHVDMDAFYANVELLDNPTLAGKPFGVGLGVLCTASYEARKYGVRSGMAAFVAKKLCPELMIMKLNFARYTELSNVIMNIFRRYDPTMHTAGCDEGYLNITEYCATHQLSPDECVQEIRATVHKETQLTVSAGIAPNKMLAKICSDKNKPNGQYHLPFDRDSIKEFMRDLSIRKVPGVGRVNERLLDAIGIKTCGDIYTHRATLSLMDKQFGLRFLLKTYLGIASNVVQPGQREERKSIGAERTFHALSDKSQIFRKLEEVAAELEGDMVSGGWTGKTVTLKYKLDTYQVFTRAKSFDRWVSSKKEDLFAIGKELLIPELPLTIRLIGLRVTKLRDLRAKSPPSGGIKRFFESANTSPRKKPKLEVEHPEDVADYSDVQLLERDEDSMPGFYEEEDGHGVLDAGEDEDVEGQNHDRIRHKPSSHQAQPRPRPPTSGPPRTTSSGEGSSSSSSGASKPRSSKPVVEPQKVDSSGGETKGHTCPICGKTLDTDNQGLNAHIDFCLSKGAIMEATAEVSSPQKKGKEVPLVWSSATRGKRKR
ncbi:IMS-domain-containing protein [Leucogyrophana mollusca]|uniref:IMS-domain-containing protein n=1 Tax=Leucogyrophana mollusca TaxID=85980 RepID=A0ACB8BI45_9AGAM|nr:IMS-domain-containing protein [Leucogyrophana mollusca]